ncbi:MAG: efflux RND transporter permease subunit [Elusimicrobia bacterium]|nr:efflux RND transporter permease subunit [Elusimicrobiota bacterium]
MKLADVCIKRPVFTTMMMLALLVVGAFSYRNLGVDLFPNIDLPFVIVTTTLAGSGPEEMETSVTKPIEEAVNTISGIDELVATSFEGMSQIMITFVLEKDIDVASQEVRDAIARVQRDLPEGTDPPVVQKFDPGAMPVMSIAVSGDLPIRELTQVAKKQVKERLESVNGVGKITMVGGREREIHVVLNPLKMASFRLTVNKVKDALQEQNIEVPGGRVESGRREFVLRTMGRLEKPADFEKVVVATVNGVPVRIRDIGRVEDTAQEARSLARLDGREAVSLIVQKQSGLNTVDVIRRVKERLGEIAPALPRGIRAEVIRDMSGFILGSVRTVEEHLVLGSILAALAVLLFMGAFRPTLIAAVAIPTSIVSTFLLIDKAGFTLNNMTLLGLALAVGIVIDDAIVVLENIFRHMEEKGTPALEAASVATKEIGLAVMATTLSLIIIFLPLANMGGIVGRFLRSYGLTVAFAVGVSLFVAFTLTPMLCSRFLKVEKEKNRFQLWVDRLNDFLKEHYGRLVLWAMANRWKVVLIAVAIALSALPFLKMVGKDFLPPDDSGEFEINFVAPEGTALPATDRILRQVEAEVRRLPHVAGVLSSVGEGEGANVNDARVYVRLEPDEKRGMTQFEIMDLARRALSKYSALRLSVSPVSHFGGGKQRDAQFQYYITGPDLGVLRSLSDQVVSALKATPGVVDVDNTLVFAKPEVKVRINRDRAQDLGVKIEDIALNLRTMVSGDEKITKYKEGDELYEVRVRVDKQFRDRKEVVGALYVPSSKVGLVRLDNVARLDEETGPSQIDRMNRQRQVGIVANLQGAPLNVAIDKAEATIRKAGLPPGYKTGMQGRSKEFGRMLTEFMIAFLLAAIFMYMILASQFEDFLHPVTIMLSLPLAIPFAVLSLIVLGQYLTIFSIMGLFMLFGIVKKNAILQVDYTNTLRREGLSRDRAILEANKTRLRPILMTTLVLVAAMTPVALGRGPGAANRATMAVVIVGGQTLCLLITLLIVPVAYSLFDDAGRWLRERRGRRPAGS